MKWDTEYHDFQVSYLLYALGKEALPIFSTFVLVVKEENGDSEANSLKV